MPVQTRMLAILADDPDPATLMEAAALIQAGELVAFATETVYGLGADATSEGAVRRIYEAKGRPPLNPLIVHVDSIPRAQACVADWPHTAALLANAFWPGPLTLVLPRSEVIPDIVTAGRETVGLRMPRPAVARHLIRHAGTPIAAPSANRSAGISPTLAEHVLADLDGEVSLILDSGQTTIGLESTVVDLTTREPRILRPGPISAQELRHVLGGLHVRHADGDTAAPDDIPLSSPGQLSVHYAPRTPAFHVMSDVDILSYDWPERAALLLVGTYPDPPPVPPSIHSFELRDPILAARDLYRTLHQCDAMNLQRIVIVLPPDLLEWHTIRDRILRASRAESKRTTES